MTTVRVAFWNVENLFHWRLQHGQGPKTRQEYEAKVRAVAHTITSLFGTVPPDAVGLAEVGSRQVLKDIVALLPIGYVGRYSEGAGNRPGLAFIFNPNAFEVAPLCPYPDKATTDKTNSRPWYIKARVIERTTGVEMLIVVNHWKSNVPGNNVSTQSNRTIRKDTARSLGEDLLNDISPVSLPVVLLGDFNVDPFDPVLDTPPLRCRRSYSTIDDWRNSTATFYNPTWRFLAPADSWRKGRVPGYQEPRPQRTHVQEDSLIDQVLFSKSFLQHDRINFCDTGVHIFHSQDLARFTGNGKLSPRRWSKNWMPGVLGVSDHFPICAEPALQ